MSNARETPEQSGTREYNEMTVDMFDCLSREAVESLEGQEVIRYFARKIKERFKRQAAEHSYVSAYCVDGKHDVCGQVGQISDGACQCDCHAREEDR